jgi:hypothetical protein
VTSVNIIVVYKKAWRIIFELYEHINYFPTAKIYKLFLGISYVFLMSYVHCEQALIKNNKSEIVATEMRFLRR